MEETSTKLTVKLNDKDVLIDVVDIIESEDYNKEYIVYTIDGMEEDQVFVSILNESEETYSLDTIEDDEEFNHVNELLLSQTLNFAEEESE